MTEDLKNKIIEYFLSNKNNTAPAIAEYFEIKTQSVNCVLNKYFKTLIQN